MPVLAVTAAPSPDWRQAVVLLVLVAVAVAASYVGHLDVERDTVVVAQIRLLVGLIAAQAITSALLLRLIAMGLVVRKDLIGVYPR